MIYFFYKVYKTKQFRRPTTTRRLAKSDLLFKFEDGVPLSCQDEHRALGDEDPDSGVSEGEGLGDRGTASISLKSSSGLHCGQEDSGG